jgi:SAM-dependent methyltransferase
MRINSFLNMLRNLVQVTADIISKKNTKKNTRSYFDTHCHDYSRDPEFYFPLIEEIRKVKSRDRKQHILDVGCGNGNFIKTLIDGGIEGHYFGTDLSSEMINMARKNLDGYSVHLFIADGFLIPMKHTVKFDLIHIDSVLHHLIDFTRGKSMGLIHKMIESLVRRLSANGILVVDEAYCSSYFIPNLTSFVVFYALKIINFLNLDFSRFNKQMRPGLEVNFLHEKQLLNILGRYGSVYRLNKLSWPMSKVYKIVLLQSWGSITYILTVPMR